MKKRRIPLKSLQFSTIWKLDHASFEICRDLSEESCLIAQNGVLWTDSVNMQSGTAICFYLLQSYIAAFIGWFWIKFEEPRLLNLNLKQWNLITLGKGGGRFFFLLSLCFQVKWIKMGNEKTCDKIAGNFQSSDCVKMTFFNFCNHGNTPARPLSLSV